MSDEKNVMEGTTGEVVLVEKGNDVVLRPRIVDIGISDETTKELESAGLIVGDLGVKISRVPIDKYKASTQRTDRISFVTKKVIGVKAHYIEGNGSVLCFGKKCCELVGLPSVRYLFPIVVYSTDNEGTIVGKKVDLKMLVAGDDLYKSICTIGKGLSATMGGIDNADLLVTCTDDKYQKVTLTPIAQAAWRQSDAILQMIMERWEQDAPFAHLAYARKVDEASFLKLLSLDDGDNSNSGNPTSGSSAHSFNAAANQDLTKFFQD
jgi:hypothetical protein